jgi:hypothetical protein
MMPRRLPLQTGAPIALDGAGSGVASIGPTGFQEVWEDLTVSVHCETTVSEATCRMYVGGDSTSQFLIDSTTWGSTGASSSNTPPKVVVGQSIFASWVDGDAGTPAYLAVTGTRVVA